MKHRKAEVDRKSKETEINVVLALEGQGKTKIKTHIGILDHMLELFAFHGFFDLALDVKKADINIDIHHTNEDIGIVLGKAFKTALGEKEGIRRFGFGASPMESTVGTCVIDVSGRGHFKFNILGGSIVQPASKEQDGYAITYLEHFMESFAKTLGATISITIQNPSDDLHTNLETVFKSFGMALDQATQIDPRRKGVPSTKGIID